MAVFDQRGQQVTYQYNSGGNINFGSVDNAPSLAAELEKLKDEIGKARASDAIDERSEIKAKGHILDAVDEAASENPDGSKIEGFLESAKTCLESFAAAGGLVQACVKAAEMVSKLF